MQFHFELGKTRPWPMETIAICLQLDCPLSLIDRKCHSMMVFRVQTSVKTSVDHPILFSGEDFRGSSIFLLFLLCEVFVDAAEGTTRHDHHHHHQ
jgi:hypothetical protein